MGKNMTKNHDIFEQFRAPTPPEHSQDRPEDRAASRDQYHRAFEGDEGMWGVESLTEGHEEGALVYEAEFCRMTAEALADLYNSTNPPADWNEASDRLRTMGLPF